MITPGLLPESYLWLTALSGRRRLRSTSTRLSQPSKRPQRVRRPEEEILREAGLPVPENPTQRRLAEIDRRLAELEQPSPKPQPARRPEEEILREAGLDRTRPLSERLEFVAKADTRRPLEERAEEMIARAQPEAMARVRTGALTGAAPGGIMANEDATAQAPISVSSSRCREILEPGMDSGDVGFRRHVVIDLVAVGHGEGVQ